MGTEGIFFILQRAHLAGSVILGKTRMGAVTGSETLPKRTVEYLYPLDPRDDGHQTSSGRSRGAGLSIAAYDWVDVSFGTDSQ
jgi:hypothetical protein